MEGLRRRSRPFRFTALDQIRKSNVKDLRIAWTYFNGSSSMNPIIVDNVMYVYGRNNSLIALDATTGKEIWIHTGLSSIATLGVNYWESKDRKDRRLIFQINHFLEEIDARTGKSILTFGKNGLVEMRSDLDRIPKKSRASRAMRPVACLRTSSSPDPLRARISSRLPATFALTTWSRESWSGLPHGPASWRIRLRNLAEGRLEIHRRRQRLGRAFAR